MKDVILGSKSLGHLGSFIIDPAGTPIVRSTLTGRVIRVETIEYSSVKSYNIIILLPNGAKLRYNNDYMLDFLQDDRQYIFGVKVLRSKNGERDLPVITAQAVPKEEEETQLTPILQYLIL